MSSTRTGGSQANHTGAQLEDTISRILESSGYSFVDRSRFNAATYLEQPIFSRQFHIESGIYESLVKVDFIIYHPKKWPKRLMIEAKWQQASGSTDEKFPYLVTNIREFYGCETVVVLAGDGSRPGALKWLRKQIDERLIRVFESGDEFIAWANRGRL